MPRKPTYLVYSAVPQGESGKSRWREIGAAFARPKGALTVLIDAVPLSGKIVLLPPKDAEGESTAESLDRSKMPTPLPSRRAQSGAADSRRCLPRLPVTPLSTPPYTDTVKNQML